MTWWWVRENDERVAGFASQGACRAWVQDWAPGSYVVEEGPRPTETEVETPEENEYRLVSKTGPGPASAKQKRTIYAMLQDGRLGSVAEGPVFVEALNAEEATRLIEAGRGGQTDFEDQAG